MKRHLVLAVALFGFSLAGNAMAADTPTRDCAEECRLLLKNCMGQTATINEQIKKLEHQITNERSAYTLEELEKLQKKLEEAKFILYSLQKR